MEKPTVITLAATSVQDTSATIGGNVISQGGAPVTERGIYYGTSPDPQTSGIKVSLDSGPGEFAASLTGLIKGTKYYFIAFATNSAGTNYGATLSFNTSESIVKPSVTTVSATLVKETEAIVGGEVMDDGGDNVTERGIFFGTSSDPITTGIKVPIGDGIGPYSATLTGLIDGTRYYYVAFAANSAGTAYGTTLSFTTLERITVKDIDGNVYQTVMIGNQRWMAENLKTKRYADGSPIQLVESNSEWETLSSTYKAYCYFNNNVSIGDTYGALYTWAAAMNGSGSTNANPSGVQGVCPAGWHLPSDQEWKEMEMFLGMNSSEADAMSLRGTTEGGELKQEGTSDWVFPNAGATNESGFTALPGGSRFSDAKFTGLYHDTSFWTATEYDNTNALQRGLGYDHSKVGRTFFYKGDGFAVRCIED